MSRDAGIVELIPKFGHNRAHIRKKLQLTLALHNHQRQLRKTRRSLGCLERNTEGSDTIWPRIEQKIRIH